MLHYIVDNLSRLSVALRSLVWVARAGIRNIFTLESLGQRLRLERIQQTDLIERPILRTLEVSSIRKCDHEFSDAT